MSESNPPTTAEPLPNDSTKDATTTSAPPAAAVSNSTDTDMTAAAADASATSTASSMTNPTSTLSTSTSTPIPNPPTATDQHQASEPIAAPSTATSNAASSSISSSTSTSSSSSTATSSHPSSSSTSTSTSSSSRPRSQPPPPAVTPIPWEPRSINLYKRENMTLIGEGTYGSVWMAKAPNGTKVALKKIRKEKKEGFPITAIREIKILKQMKHPNIVSLKDVVSSHMPGKEGDVFMVFEFLEHDLTGLLESKVQLSDAVVKYYFKCILEGLSHLHSKSVLHRDIKGANILISNNGDVKIADLGLARGMAKGGYTNRVVTLWYRAPELLLGACEYDGAIDMWSAGCLFAELLTRGTVLFPGNNTELDQLTKILAVCGSIDETNWPGVSKLKYFQQFTPKPQKRTLRSMFASQRSQQAIDLLDKLLALNPAERLTADQALQHEYFFEEPLPIQPHQHPQFIGNHHEFGTKTRRRNPPPQASNNRPAAGMPNNMSTNPAGMGGYPNRMGPPPFDRMQVSSHDRFGTGGGGYQQHQQQHQGYQQGGQSANYRPNPSGPYRGGQYTGH